MEISLFSLILQCFSYGYWWLLFVGLVAVASFFGRVWWIILAHMIASCVVVYLDFVWFEEEVRQITWNIFPDVDGVFSLGILARVLIVNLFLCAADYFMSEWRRKFTAP